MNNEHDPHPAPASPVPPFESAPGLPFVWTPPRKKFQHKYGRHIVLFVLTFVTTTFAQSFLVLFITLTEGLPVPAGLFGWETFRAGLWYSLPLLTILGAHEFGHYFACRRYNVDATLPYFLPAPIVLTGTLGAVIRIREAFPSKRALFDIAVAGPIAGFVALIPFLLLGVWWSTTAESPEVGMYFGEPLLFKAVEWVRFGPLAPKVDVFLHPMGFAAWFGMLATALNLMPFGQLDGGHLAYALFGRRAAWVSVATLGAALGLTLLSSSWIAMTVMLVVMALFLGVRHPRVWDEHESVGNGRKLIAFLTLIIFVICFTPVPVEFIFGGQ